MAIKPSQLSVILIERKFLLLLIPAVEYEIVFQVNDWNSYKRSKG